MKRLSLILATLLLIPGAALAAAADQPGYLMRYADIGGGNIVFTYEGDLWLVPDRAAMRGASPATWAPR